MAHCLSQQPGLGWSPPGRPRRAALRCRAAGSSSSFAHGDVLQLSAAGAPPEYACVHAVDAAGIATLVRKGQLVRLAVQPDGSQSLEALGAHRQGGWPSADSLTLQRFPVLSQVLGAMHSHALGELPLALQAVARVDSLASLEAAMQADAAFWCDGIAPGAPPRSELQQALNSAGELAALLAGRRGVVLVQLFNGFARGQGQPLYQPGALQLLERALTAPGVAAIASVAPGGVGLTGVLYAEREPFASWAAHLASFGCQANTVAGSAYYKLLIGQLLGYRLDNVLAYVAASGEPASRELQQQVASDIRGLSKVKPKLPWSPDDANVRKPKPAQAAAAGTAASSGSSSGSDSSGSGGGRQKKAGGFGAKR